MDLNPDLKNETELTAPTKITLNPATLLAPIPVVLLSCRGLPGEGCDQPNLITVAWAGTINSEPPIDFCVHPAIPFFPCPDQPEPRICHQSG